jgi:hypothetical protein
VASARAVLAARATRFRPRPISDLLPGRRQKLLGTNLDGGG